MWFFSKLLYAVSRLLQLKPYRRIELNVNSIRPIESGESIRIDYSQLYCPHDRQTDKQPCYRIIDHNSPHLIHLMTTKAERITLAAVKPSRLRKTLCDLRTDRSTRTRSVSKVPAASFSTSRPWGVAFWKNARPGHSRLQWTDDVQTHDNLPAYLNVFICMSSLQANCTNLI